VVDIWVVIGVIGIFELNISVGFLGWLSVAKIDEMPFLDFVLVFDILCNIGVTVSKELVKII
jgi:hypothetical protein